MNKTSLTRNSTQAKLISFPLNFQKKNGTYEFLSGVAINERTQFLRLNDPKDYENFQVKYFDDESCSGN